MHKTKVKVHKAEGEEWRSRICYPTEQEWYHRRTSSPRGLGEWDF